MKCKKCRREIVENAIYCPWCGHQQLTASNEVRVPIPRHKGNKWFAQVVVGDSRVYISADSEEEYYAKAKAAKSRQIEIKKAPTKITLGEAIDSYIKSNDSTLSPSTLKAYKSYRKCRFAKYIDKPLERIDYQRMVNTEAKAVSAKTVRNAWRLVTASMRYKSIDPPIVNLPQPQKKERPWLDFEQVQTFYAAVEGKGCELAALLALNGLRRSEILYLSSDDIDLDTKTIHVHGAKVFSPSGAMVEKSTTKNATSTRDVKIIMPRLIDLLRGKKGALITTHPNTLYSQINAICRENNLPSVGFHGLRHSYISLGFHLGVQDLTIANQVGHATVSTTHNIYRHLAEKDAIGELHKMEEHFSGRTPCVPNQQTQ